MPRATAVGKASPKPAAKGKPASKAALTGAIPEGFHTITPTLTVSDGEGAIAFYEKALGAELKSKMCMPGTKKIVHSCLQIGSSKLFLHDETPNMPAPKHGMGSSFYLYVADVDAQHKRAVAAGMKEIMPPADMFWGDRMSTVMCPYGNSWTFASHVRNVGEQEMAEGMKAWATKFTAH